MEFFTTVLTVFGFFITLSVAQNQSEPDACFNIEHETMGMIGNCIPASACIAYANNGEIIAKDDLCPSYPSDYTCCFNEKIPGREMRGAWIATVANIDWPDSPSPNSTVQKIALESLVDKLYIAGFNAIYFQVRPCGDALYNSQIEPWSKYLTGAQGVAPSPMWDPLAHIVSYAHERNMEVHAWINPYRASMSPTSADLDPSHMAIQYPEFAYSYDSYLWMDPGAEVVQNRTFEVAMDLVRRYEIDGLHMDDYFYPYPVTGLSFPDSKTYSDYVSNGGELSLDDWRRNNVNILIERLYTGLHSVRPSIKFTISPFGIYRACHPTGMPCSIAGFDQYSQIYCDAKLWLVSGWVDALIPQLYWKIDPVPQSYPVLLNWWVSQEANPLKRHVYAGNYLSRIREQDWDLTEIQNQIDITREKDNRNRGSWGNVQFSSAMIKIDYKNAGEFFKNNIYPFPAYQPPFPWLENK